MRAQSPWTQVFGRRDQYVWKYRPCSVGGSRQKPRVIPGHGLRMTSSPTARRTDRPFSSTTSASIPGQGPLKELGRIGVQVVQPRMQPAISEPTANFMMINRDSPTVGQYRHQGPGING